MIKLNLDFVEQVMKEYDLNQRELADRIGMTKSAVNRHIKGTRKQPSSTFIMAMLKAFPKYTFEDFFSTGEE